jgi:hypothetical protein
MFIHEHRRVYSIYVPQNVVRTIFLRKATDYPFLWYSSVSASATLVRNKFPMYILLSDTSIALQGRKVLVQLH